MDLSFYKGKRVLITGHTGFKGSWMSVVLANVGADVIGYSSFRNHENRLFNLCNVEEQIVSIKGDIRDIAHIDEVLSVYMPEIVIHMAAQSLVRDGYYNPVYTYYTNVMGTVNVLECSCRSSCVRSFVNVTSDKVYFNKERDKGYQEDDLIDGYDPYSNSKSCSELITNCYRKSFFLDKNIPVSTVRSGNAIGGGDFTKNRIIPDCVRAAILNEDIIVRNPYSTRPYQHVLEPICAYLMIAMEQFSNPQLASSYNVGPDDKQYLQTGELVDLFIEKWGGGMKRINRYDGGPHEAQLLKLDCTKIKSTFEWSPRWNIQTSMEKVVEWTKIWIADGDVRTCMDKQIAEYLKE